MAAPKAKSARLQKCRSREEQQGKQDAELCRGDGRAGGGRNEFIAAKLLHNESGDAHAHASAQNGEQSGQAGDHKDLQLVQITG